METCIAPGIKSWAEDERPREKLLNKGKQHLSNAELLAILISSGKKAERLWMWLAMCCNWPVTIYMSWPAWTDTN